MKILLIRHAEPDYPNNTLTEKGFVEAEYLSERLKHSDITHIYSSPLNRALLTANPTAEKIGKEVVICDWLTEFNGKILVDNNDTIALFCHFGLGMVIASHLTGISPVLLWQTMFMPTSSVTMN